MCSITNGRAGVMDCKDILSHSIVHKLVDP